jgi:hypothetical protein
MKRFFIFLCIVLIGCTASQQKPQPAKVPPIQISTDELFNAYEENAVDADLKYKGKALIVSGTVDEITSGETIQVVMPAKRAYGLLGVRCEFDRKYASDIAKLKKGQQIKVQGICNGVIGSVSLTNCSLLPQ